MSDDTVTDSDRKKHRFDFDRHTPQYRFQFEKVTEELQEKCPIAWSDTYGGHWVASSSHAVFELARCPHISNDHDPNGERRGYHGITIPHKPIPLRAGILEMDPPEQRWYRNTLNPYLSPAAVKRWQPFIDEVVRASIDEKIEQGRTDFVDDLANVVPAVLTLAMLGIPLKKGFSTVSPRTLWSTPRRILRRQNRFGSRTCRWLWTCWPMSMRSATNHALG
jgi:cytochrome P450